MAYTLGTDRSDLNIVSPFTWIVAFANESDGIL